MFHLLAPYHVVGVRWGNLSFTAVQGSFFPGYRAGGPSGPLPDASLRLGVPQSQCSVSFHEGLGWAFVAM